MLGALKDAVKPKRGPSPPVVPLKRKLTDAAAQRDTDNCSPSLSSPKAD